MVSATTTSMTMPRLLLSWLVAALQATTASAVVMASATQSVLIPPDAQSPRPTEPPLMFDLGRRQNGFTYLVAPDNTCGWVSVNTNVRWTCDGSNMRCVFWLADGSLPDRHVCCPAEGCRTFNRFSQTACVSRGESCDAACSSNGRIAKCNGTALPYCNTRFWGSSGGFPFFSCGNTSWTEPTVYLTIKPGTARFFATSTSLATVITATDTSGGSVITKIITVTSADQTNGVVEGVGGDGSGGGGAAQPTGGGGGSNNNNNNNNDGANTGAIVGGAVGGAAVLAIAALAAVLLLRRRRKQKVSAATPQGGYYPASPSQQDSTFLPSPYTTPGHPVWGQQQHNPHLVSSASPPVTAPPNAPHYAGAYPKYPAPMAEVDGTGASRVHEMGTN